MGSFRIEQDSIGKREVPMEAYYGVQTMRAAENFRISGQKEHPQMIRSMAEIKLAAARANEEAGVLTPQVAKAIVAACTDVLNGRYLDQFIVDPVQGGAGTSLNMNMNEVIANRAIEILGGEHGQYALVHPNDHVNCGQSTNDVYPSAGKIAVIRLLQKSIGQLDALHAAWQKKARNYNKVVKMGRTELQDAVPLTFGQTFRAYAAAIARDRRRFNSAIKALQSLNMGATAIGTGLNADRVYCEQIIPELSRVTGLPLRRAENLIDATQNADVWVYVSGIVKACAVNLSKSAHDLRLMASGPRTGFGEIRLAPKQNGSSIMPGKINPVIPEVMNEIAFQVIGCDSTVTQAAEAGQLELNAFEPIIFHSMLTALDALCCGIQTFADCVSALTVDKAQCKEELENSIWLVTALSPQIGYEAASKLAKKALREHLTPREILLREKQFTSQELESVMKNSY